MNKLDRLTLMKTLYKRQAETCHKYPLQIRETDIIPVNRVGDSEDREDFWFDGELNFDMEVVR